MKTLEINVLTTGDKIANFQLLECENAIVSLNSEIEYLKKELTLIKKDARPSWIGFLDDEIKYKTKKLNKNIQKIKDVKQELNRYKNKKFN